jgi:hypothetical protein
MAEILSIFYRNICKMLHSVTAKAPSSYGRIKSGAFYLGALSYLHSAKRRKVFNAAARGIGQIATTINPRYRLGETREAIVRELGLEEDRKSEVIASDLLFNQPLMQKGISENMRRSLAWKFIGHNISGEKNTLFLAKNVLAAIVGTIAVFASTPLLLIGSGLLITRSISDWIRSNQQRDEGFRYLTSNPISKIKFMLDYHCSKEVWTDKSHTRFMDHLGRLDAELAAHLEGKEKTN